MNRAFPEAMVAGYEDLIESMNCDSKDRYVLACAVKAGAHAIGSDNNKHFRQEALEAYRIDCLTAGEFFLRLSE